MLHVLILYQILRISSSVIDSLNNLRRPSWATFAMFSGTGGAFQFSAHTVGYVFCNTHIFNCYSTNLGINSFIEFGFLTSSSLLTIRTTHRCIRRYIMLHDCWSITLIKDVLAGSLEVAGQILGDGDFWPLQASSNILTRHARAHHPLDDMPLTHCHMYRLVRAREQYHLSFAPLSSIQHHCGIGAWCRPTTCGTTQLCLLLTKL